MLLSLDGVSYRYPGGRDRRPALQDVSLQIAPGELVVIAGGSGSGKSTLLRAAAGLVPHFYGGEIAGEITVAGLEVREHRPGALAGVVGSLFQDPETQIVMGTVRAELAFPLQNQGAGEAEIARGVEEAAVALGIAPLLDRPTAELSGGELQRVALGAAMVTRPALLALDEPTSQLDPVAGEELLGVLRRLNGDADVAVLLCEHRLERVLPIADRVVAMRDGSIAFDGPPDRFLSWALEAAPELATPGARLLRQLGLAPQAGVRAARGAIRSAAVRVAPRASSAQTRPPVRDGRERPSLELRRVWHELQRGPAILRGVSLRVEHGERVALMGRNGAGKSTLLRHAAGLQKPTRGAVIAHGRVALLLQTPGDYLIHDTVAAEAPSNALSQVGLDAPELANRHPRELSGGERQRLALAVVLGDEDPPAVLALDEPTRGMDRAARDRLASLLQGIPSAVVVATHDPEFAVAFADRVVLLADGGPIADGPTEEILGGGLYFATETARIVPGALEPDDVAVVAPGPEPVRIAG